MNRAHLICHSRETCPRPDRGTGIHPSVIARERNEQNNLYLQYITGILPVIKKYFKIFSQKRRTFEIYVVYKNLK